MAKFVRAPSFQPAAGEHQKNDRACCRSRSSSRCRPKPETGGKLYYPERESLGTALQLCNVAPRRFHDSAKWHASTDNQSERVETPEPRSRPKCAVWSKPLLGVPGRVGSAPLFRESPVPVLSLAPFAPQNREPVCLIGQEWQLRNLGLVSHRQRIATARHARRAVSASWALLKRRIFGGFIGRAAGDPRSKESR